MADKNHLGKVKAGKDVICLNIMAYVFCSCADVSDSVYYDSLRFLFFGGGNHR